MTNTATGKLRQYDTPTVCNVIELFALRPRHCGFMHRRIKAVFPDLPPMVGYASTVTCRTFTAPVSKETVLPDQIERFAELSGPAVAVLQNLDSGGAAAVFGDVMCSSYQAFGAVGLITNGPGRDFEGIEQLAFAAFCDGAVCSHGWNHLLDVHVPVQVGGISIVPDDLLHGDGSGVTTIPKAIAADVADACAEFAAAEKVVIDLAQRGMPTIAELRDAYDEKARRIAQLGRRLRKA